MLLFFGCSYVMLHIVFKHFRNHIRTNGMIEQTLYCPLPFTDDIFIKINLDLFAIRI